MWLARSVQNLYYQNEMSKNKVRSAEASVALGWIKGHWMHYKPECKYLVKKTKCSHLCSFSAITGYIQAKNLLAINYNNSYTAWQMIMKYLLDPSESTPHTSLKSVCTCICVLPFFLSLSIYLLSISLYSSMYISAIYLYKCKCATYYF